MANFMENKPAVYEELDAAVERLYPELEGALLTLLRHPSVRGEAAPGAPFGKAVLGALTTCLDLCASYGLAVENLDGYIGLADLKGTGDGQVGVLGHLDVVPADEAGWEYPPFGAVQVGERIYGRGTLDDKGPLLSALFGGLAIKACGLPLKKTVRFLFGCDEETGFGCVQHYLQVRKPPDCGFTPDGCFPLVIGEKGLCGFRLRKAWRAAGEGGKPFLRAARAGTAPNCIPDRAEAVLEGANATLAAAAKAAGLSCAQEGGRLVLTAQGKAAHGSLPALGENALMKLVRFLAPLDFAPQGAKAYLADMAALFADELGGAGLGAAGADAVSELTAAPVLLEMTPAGGSLHCDLRFPVTHDAGRYRRLLAALAEQHGLALEIVKLEEPLYGGSDNPLAETLLGAYRACTGDMSGPLIIGGGSYAKALPNFFSFGAAFADTPLLAHEANEYTTRTDLLTCAKIYARAIYELAV